MDEYPVGRIPDIETIQSGIWQYDLLYYTTKIPTFQMLNGCNFLVFVKIEEIFFQEMFIFLKILFILEISKHDFWQFL